MLLLLKEIIMIKIVQINEYKTAIKNIQGNNVEAGVTYIDKAYNTSFSYKLALKICKLNLQKRTLKIAEENLKYVKDAAERMERQFNGES